MGDRDRYKPDRPVFCGNFEYDARQEEIERLFEKYGPLERVDMKTGFAFVYMKDQRDAEDAIRALDRMEFGRQRRRLAVDFARGDGSVKQREDLRRRQAKPATTLFVVNFDPSYVRERDLERHFDRYGKLVRVQIKKNFAFIQYDTLDEAIKAKENLHQSVMNGRVLTVEYVAHEDHSAVGGGGGGSYRRRSRSPAPRDRGRSRSPRGDYGRRGHSPPRRSPPPRRRSPPPRRSPSPPPRRNSPPPRRDSPPRRRADSRDPPPRRSLSPAPRRDSPPPRRMATRSRSPAPRRTPSMSPGPRSMSPR